MNGIKKLAYFCVCLLLLSVMLPLIFQIEGEHVRRKNFDMLQGGLTVDAFYSGIYGYELFNVCYINNNGEIEIGDYTVYGTD